MNKWKEIWTKEERVHNTVLEVLIKANGFDTGSGSFTVEKWKEYTSSLFSKIDSRIVGRDKFSIFEIGCGAGAFLYQLYLQDYKVGGLDYSPIQVELAKRFISEEGFCCGEAAALDTTYKFDVVISHSVFQYFPNESYAETVINKMLEKSNGIVAFFDINDQEKKEKYHLIRMADMNEEEYWEKYNGLSHLFYKKQWFREIAKKNGCTITIWDQDFIGYDNSQLRFNVLMEKNG